MSAWKARQPGYYWVNLPNEGGWQPAYWTVQDWRERMGYWSITDSEYELDDEDFAEIAEPCVRRESQNARLIAALTPSAETKAAYIGEVWDDVMVRVEDEEGDMVERTERRHVSWTAIKDVMALIRKEGGIYV